MYVCTLCKVPSVLESNASHSRELLAFFRRFLKLEGGKKEKLLKVYCLVSVSTLGFPLWCSVSRHWAQSLGVCFESFFFFVLLVLDVEQECFIV